MTVAATPDPQANLDSLGRLTQGLKCRGGCCLVSAKPARLGPEDLVQLMLAVASNVDQQASVSLQVLIGLFLLMLMACEGN